MGPIGADIAGLVGSSIFLFEAERISPDDLEKRCLQDYLAGLRDVGWRGSEGEVHFDYLARRECATRSPSPSSLSVSR